MRRLKSFCSRAALVCGAWLTATAAMAQAPATPVSPLTVEGANRKALEKQAQAFAEAYGEPTAKLGVLARWTDPACVTVTGLIPEQGAQFRTRIEEVAKAVGAPVAPPKCTPNIEIVFTNQPQKYLDAASAKSPAILGNKGDKTVTRPIQAWYATEDSGLRARTAGPADDGPPPPSAAAMIAHVTQERFGVNEQRSYRGAGEARRCVDPGVAAHNTSMENHIVGSPTYVVDTPCPHSQFLNVLVVVDAAHMGDVSVDLTADYLALVALSQPKPRSLDGCLALPSVLDLYAKDCPGRDPPAGLTPADTAYLTGLYAADLTVVRLNTQTEQSDIAGRMVKIMTTAPKPAR
jgi:hypothetical protein